MSGNGSTLATPGQFLHAFGYPRADSADFANAVSATPPTPVFPGKLWWNTNDGQLYVWYVDPNSAQWVAIQAAQGGAAPFQVGPGLSLNVGTSPPTIDVVTPYLPLTGGTLSGAGNLAIRGGLIVGATGAIPTAGNVTLNQNTVLPVATYGGSGFRVVGADGQVAGLVAETYGASPPILAGRNSAGTAASQGAVAANSVLLRLQGVGYAGAATYGGGATIDSYAAENWTTTSIGSGLRFYSTPVTTNVSAVSMTVQAGVGIGTAAAPAGNGTLTLNANTVVQPSGPASTNSLSIVGADNVGVSACLDAFGASPIPQLFFRRARGTAAAPTAVQAGDFTGGFNWYARGATSYGNAGSILMGTTQIWTDTAQGSELFFYTNPTGTTSAVPSLTLQGNTATFSGTVSIPAGSSLALNSGSTSAGRLSCDGNNTFASIGSGTGSFYVQRSDGATNLTVVDNSGNFTIAGATATKPGSTAWVNPSAREIKQDIQPYTGSLGDLLDLTPVTYRYSDDSGFATDETHIGLVHDETAHMPEMHRTATIGQGDDAREVDALDCSAVTFALINAIKELKAEIDDLKRQLGA